VVIMADDPLKEIQSLTEKVEVYKEKLEELGDVVNFLQADNNKLANSQGVIETQTAKISQLYKRKTQTLRNVGQSMQRLVALTTKRLLISKKQEQQLKDSTPKLTRYISVLLNMTPAMKVATDATTFLTGAFQSNNKVVNMLGSRMAVLAGSMLGFIGIALSVSIVLGTLSLAIQGTESPLYETTSAMDGTSASGTTLHSVIEGVIMIFQGEGEGGLVGALNVSAAAFTIATAAAMLFRSTAAFMIAPVLLAIGAFQLIKQATDNFALSLTGAISTLLVTGAIIVTKGAVLTGGIATAATTLSGFIAAVLLGVGLIVGAVTGFVAVLMGYGSTIEAIIITVVSAFALAIGAIVLGVSLPVAAVGAAIVGLVVLIIRFRDQIRNFFVGIVETASDGITKFRGRIEKGIKILKLFIELFVARKRKQLDDAIAYIRAVPGKIRDGLLNGMRNVAKGLVNIINNFIRAVNKLEIPDFIPKIGGKKPNIPLVSIPALAKGGVVSTPTLAMIGESGPEAVVPLNRASQFGKNNVTVNINVSGVTDRSDKRALAREISDIIAQEMRRNGGSPTRGRF
tara:strand:+ start:322 stop:2031 length:1710 start_codon:yes stop_codon:yes gene_type:complete